jgi:VanZ family protein
VLALVVSVVLLFAPSGGGAPSVPGLDKVVHAAIFLSLAGTARWRFGPHPRLLGAVVGYAVVSEVVQAALLSQRRGDPYDVVADVVGAVAGWLLAGRWAAGR